MTILTRAKYGNTKVQIDNITFDSIAEGARYRELRLMEKAGAIAALQVHPSYELQPPFKDRDGKHQRAIAYVADFAYLQGGDRVVEDVKGGSSREGTQTQAYKLKAKMFRYRYSALVYRVVER